MVIENKAVGPHSVDDVKAMLLSGKITYADFVYKPGLSQWTPISQIKDLERRLEGDAETRSTEIPVESKYSEDAQFNGWLLSARKDGESIQSGPYTKEQIIEKIDKHEVKYDDQVWNKSLSGWQKLGELEEFNRRKGMIDPMTAPGIVVDAEVGEKVFQEALEFQSQETQPGIRPEVSAPAQEMHLDAPKLNPIHETEKPQKEIPLPIPKADPLSEFDPPKSSGRKRLIIASSGAALGMVMAYFGLNAYKQTMIESSGHGTVTKTSSTFAVSANKSVPSVVPAVITPQLKVIAIKANTPSRPQLAFETNLPAGSVIKVELSAAYGRILNYPRLVIEKDVTVVSGQMPTLDLVKEDLPYGDYRVKAIAGTLSSQSNLLIGVHDSALVAKLEKHRGDLTIQEKKERMALLDGVKFLAKADGELAKAFSKANPRINIGKKADKKKVWNTAFAEWRKNFLQKTASTQWLEKQNPKTLIYPGSIGKYAKAKSKLTEVSKSYASKMGSSRTVASADSGPEQVRQDFKKILQSLEADLKNIKK